MIKSVLITGANSGIGKDCARQLALQSEITKIYLGCRNEAKAKAAKRDLEQSTGKSIFEIVLMDMSKTESIRAAVAAIQEPIDALVMNAGGLGGPNPGGKNDNGVIQLVATNVVGHAVLLDALLQAKKLTQVAVYAGSEAARGVLIMGMRRPHLKTSSVDEFASICDGTYFGKTVIPMFAYASVKYLGALWMASMARQYPNIRFVTVSPGGTNGTEVATDQPLPIKLMFKYVVGGVMPVLGLTHPVEVGAKRYVDAVNDPSYKSGVFYASQNFVTGRLVDQATKFDKLNNKIYQDNANEAIHRFIS